MGSCLTQLPVDPDASNTEVKRSPAPGALKGSSAKQPSHSLGDLPYAHIERLAQWWKTAGSADKKALLFHPLSAIVKQVGCL